MEGRGDSPGSAHLEFCFHPASNPHRYGWGTETKLLTLVPLSLVDIFKQNYIKSEKEQKGNEYQKHKQCKNSHIPKIQMSDPEICLPFCYWELTGVTGTLLALFHPVFTGLNPGTRFPKPIFLAGGIKDGSGFHSEAAFCLGAYLVVVLAREGEAL